jgi:hypothetical protein
MTAGGSANPFRASSAGIPNVGQLSFGTSAFQPTGASSQPFGTNMFGIQQQQPQANTTTSLI